MGVREEEESARLDEQELESKSLADLVSVTIPKKNRRVKDVAIAKMLWSGTNSGNDGVLGEGWKAERRRVAYRGLIWLERREFDLSHTFSNLFEN